MTHYRLREGDTIHRPNEMLLGTTAVGTYNLSIGDTMQVYSNYYKIVGIFETGIAWEDGAACWP